MPLACKAIYISQPQTWSGILVHLKQAYVRTRATAQILNSIQRLSPPVSEISLAC